MVYAYKYTLCRRAVVATFDLSASNLEALSKDHWLKNSLNAVQLRLKDKAFDEAAVPGVGAPLVAGGKRGSKRIRF